MRESLGKVVILPQMISRRFFIPLILALLVLVPGRFAGAGPYSQPGFYEPEVLRLGNGLTLILKERGEAPSVAIRLVVGVGHDDFSQGVKQSAHMVEHLFYMGTSIHDETEIDRLVQDHGGYSNAFTGSEETIHHLDIFNQYYLWGLDFLFELLTDSSFSEEQVGLAAGVIAREEGGTPSGLHRWLYDHDITKPAWEMAYERLLPNPDYHFGLESCEDISRAELLAAFQQFYVPGNMTLIVAGKFNRADLLARIRSTFGALPAAPPPARRQWNLPFPTGPAELDGTLAPVLDSEGNVELMFRTDGVGAADYYALQVIDRYLDRKVFEELRFKRGLAYDSGSSYAANRKWGMLAAGGTVEIDRMPEVRALLEAEVDRLRAGKVAAAEIDKIKRQILLAQANGYESNAAVADYYANNLAGFQARGSYQNYEDAIAAVTSAQVAGAAARYLPRERAVLVMSRPTATIEELSVLLAAALLLAILTVWAFFRYRHKKIGSENCQTKQ
ncbi:MAG: insulinase family protein [Desulfobulbaceae bacterium]|nr:insulinase family protein [Desulfobulbaceae bacterium]